MRTSKSASELTCFVHFHFQMCFSPQPRGIFRHQNFKKCSRTLFFSILTSECAFRHSGVQFFDIRTSKSASELTCFVHFHFQMRLSPQLRAIFRHQNFKKCSRTLSFFSILTSECAFRHSGVQFFDIRTSKSASELTCFVYFHFHMCFSPQRRAIFHFSSDHMTPHPPL